MEKLGGVLPRIVLYLVQPPPVTLPRAAGFLFMLVADQGTFNPRAERESF